MTSLRAVFSTPLLLLPLACGPDLLDEGDDEIGETSTSETETSETETSTSETDASNTSESETDTSETETDTSGTDTGDPFGNGEDTCEGDRFGECMELAWADLTSVVLSDADQDGAWSPGEALTATVTYASTEGFINYPALVAQTDNPQVSVPWITADFFGVTPDQPIVYEVVFEADPAIEPGTQVGLKIAAASGLGQITACDCPEIMVDAWVDFQTIE